MIFEYDPKGVCSVHYTFDIDENTNCINSLKVIGGCQGNLSGISKIVVGMHVDKVIEAFANTDCHRKGTSCPDQISKALRKYKESK